jgi:hypothetical protein
LPWTASPTAQKNSAKEAYKDDEEGDDDEEEEEDTVVVHNWQSRTTLALLQTFHVQMRFWLSRLAVLLRARL